MVLLPKDPEALANLRRPTPTEPLRVLVSGCLMGQPCGVDGTWFARMFQSWSRMPVHPRHALP